MTKPIKRDKRNIGKKVKAIHPESIYYGRIGIVRGFRGDQARGNPYVQVQFPGVGVDTISARWLEIQSNENDNDV